MSELTGNVLKQLEAELMSHIFNASYIYRYFLKKNGDHHCTFLSKTQVREYHCTNLS